MQLLLDGHGTAAICEKLSISQPTLWRWKQLPAWQEDLWVAVRGEQRDGEVHMRSLVPLATQVVQRLLISGTDNIKLSASKLVFGTVASLVAREEQQQMLIELEQQLKALEDKAGNKLPVAGHGEITADVVAGAHDSAHKNQQKEESFQ
jgi:hypothetical protein